MCNTLTNDRVPDGIEEDKEDFYVDFINETIQDLSGRNNAVWDKQAEDMDDYDIVCDIYM